MPKTARIVRHRFAALALAAMWTALGVAHVHAASQAPSVKTVSAMVRIDCGGCWTGPSGG